MSPTSDFHADVSQIAGLRGRTAATSNEIRHRLRMTLHAAADPIVSEARAKVGSGGRLREQIRAGINSSVAETATSTSIRITSTGPLAAAWDAEEGWRHPVFGNRGRTVQQRGAPGYFWRTVSRHTKGLTAKVEQAMREAANSL